MHASPSLTAELLRARAATGTLWVTASGPSMGRRYGAGTRLRIAAPVRSPRFGEVWAFVDDQDRLVAHRCVYQDRAGRWRFRGDAVRALDPPVVVAQLVGRVVEIDDGGNERLVPRRRDAVGPTVRVLVTGVVSVARRIRVRVTRTVKDLSRSPEEW